MSGITLNGKHWFKVAKYFCICNVTCMFQYYNVTGNWLLCMFECFVWMCLDKFEIAFCCCTWSYLFLNRKCLTQTLILYNIHVLYSYHLYVNILCFLVFTFMLNFHVHATCIISISIDVHYQIVHDKNDISLLLSAQPLYTMYVFSTHTIFRLLLQRSPACHCKKVL